MALSILRVESVFISADTPTEIAPATPGRMAIWFQLLDGGRVWYALDEPAARAVRFGTRGGTLVQIGLEYKGKNTFEGSVSVYWEGHGSEPNRRTAALISVIEFG